MLDNKEKTVVFIAFIAFVFAVIIFLLIVEKAKRQLKEDNATAIHNCNWEDCPYNGRNKEEAISIAGKDYDEQGTDSDLCTLLHCIHPDWTYEKVENEVFSTDYN